MRWEKVLFFFFVPDKLPWWFITAKTSYGEVFAPEVVKGEISNEFIGNSTMSPNFELQ
jgi:hypothetical protein